MSIYGATIYRVIRMRISNLQKIPYNTLRKVDFRLKIAKLSPNKASSRIKDMLMNCLKFSFAAVCLGILLSLVSTIALSQTQQLTVQAAAPSLNESWVGWIETPKQQLRTIVRLQRDKEGNAIAGSIVSPDQTPIELPLSNFQIDASGAWQFTVENPTDAKRTAKYSGKQSSDDQVVGDFEQVGEKLSLNMQKFDSLPLETRSNLGANSVWLGTLDLVVRKMDFRIRVYSKPPFATADAPRMLFDSMTQNAVGIPAQVSVSENGSTTFEMKTIGAKFAATLNEEGNQLVGRFIQGPLPLPLVMKLLTDEISGALGTTKDSTSSVKKEKEMLPSSANTEPSRRKVVEEGSPPFQELETIVLPEKTAMVSSPFFDETPFEVSYGSSKPRNGKNAAIADQGIKLAGTFTLPKLKKGSKPRKFPAVIMVSGSGPQDRNETIGRHKPFEAIAHFLAENGIASLRYDDRGVGESTGDFLHATSADFAKDAIAVWSYAKTIPGLNASKIGILGHSEGGLIGPMAAVWEPSIAFLILIAPPGMTGSEILKTQIDRISELQGMNETDRKATMVLQGNLQNIASGYIADESTMRRDIQNAIKMNWDSLKSLAKSQDPNADLDQIRKDLTSQIDGQFDQLRMPWFQFFLKYDPTPNWMMIRCPTLAIWGSHDVQVLPELNRAKIEKAIKRNHGLDAQLTILPGLNHLMQTSKSGLPNEYNVIEETISPTVLRTIRIWAEQQQLIEP